MKLEATYDPRASLEDTFTVNPKEYRKKIFDLAVDLDEKTFISQKALELYEKCTEQEILYILAIFLNWKFNNIAKAMTKE